MVEKTSTTRVPKKTAAEKLAEHPLAQYVTHPAEMSMFDKLTAQADLLAIAKPLAQEESDFLTYTAGYRDVIAWVRSHACPDVDAFDQASKNFSMKEAFAFADLYVEAVGE